MVWPGKRGRKTPSDDDWLKGQDLATKHDLHILTAVEVAMGNADLAVEIERAQERRAYEDWARSFTYRPGSIAPLWDLEPKRFYLFLDGEGPAQFAADYGDILLIEVSTSELMAHLQYASGRNDDATHQWQERSKTRQLGYRWHLRRAVTPPFLYPFDKTEIGIRGGMHRVHLAVAEGAVRIPAIIDAADRDAVKAILPSACAYPPRSSLAAAVVSPRAAAD